MRHSEGYHRHRGVWRPSDRQRQLLDLLAESQSNAEIAECLGVTVDGAKWHVGELLAETGLKDRQALAAWWREERERRQQPAFLSLWPPLPRVAIAGSAAAVVLVIVTGWLLWGRGSGDGEDLPLPQAASADVAPSPSTTPQRSIAAGPAPPCDTPPPGGFRPVTTEELRAEGLVELGRVIEPQTCPLQVSNRHDLALFWLADGGEVDPSEAGMYGFPGALMFRHERELFRASMIFSDSLDPAEYLEDPIEIVVEYRDRARLYRKGSQAAFGRISLEGIDSGRRRVAITSDGTLFFEPGPLPEDLATNSVTGEALDVSGMTLLGQLQFTSLPTTAEAWTRCPLTTGICNVELPYILESLKLPVGGVLSSVPVPSAQEKFLGVPREDVLGYELDTGEYVLRFSSPDGGYTRVWDGSCPDRRDLGAHDGCSPGPLAVAAGDEFHTWTLTSVDAFTPDGKQVSLLITRAGDLYVGDLTLEIGCPCRNAR
jgi:DNA-binding CsgD family transcriptional regulator